MLIKIKCMDGTSHKVDVDETSTIGFISSYYCNGHNLAVGFPPQPLSSDCLVSEKIRPGDLIIVLPDSVGNQHDEEERVRNKERKRANKLAKRAAKMAKTADFTPAESFSSIVEDEPYHDDGIACKHRIPF